MYKIGIDIGGTFTDCVIAGKKGRIAISKSPSIADDPTEGVLAALEEGCRIMGLTTEEVLSECEAFIHGCTIATNAIIERTGVKTAYITTKGHEDTLLIGKLSQKIAGLTEQEITHTSRLTTAEPPLVPAELSFGITERVIWNGDVLIPLNEDDLDRIVRRLEEEKVEAVAICLLWSFMNPAHEKAIESVLKKKLPHVYCSLSSEISPTFGEYERASATVINAYVGPKIKTYLTKLQEKLLQKGYSMPLLAMQCDGGTTYADDAAKKAVLMVDSGPVGGVAGGKWLGQKYKEPNIICTDVGGTSIDVGLIHKGDPQREDEPVISQYQFRIPRVDIKSVGAGGGSIAWIDVVGALRVGPQSAGANPGPACYGRGGELPTLTDADLILGYLNPEYFLGGRLLLDRKKAERAMAGIARKLNMDIIETAHAVFKIMNARMADLIRRCTVQRGFDPRNFSLIAYGGAGPTHVAFFGQDVGARRMYVLPNATVFSAFGMLTSPITNYGMASRRMASPYTKENCRELDKTVKALKADVLSRFKETGISKKDVEITISLSMRYKMQAHSVETDIENASITLDSMHSRIIPAFEKKYGEIYGTGTNASEAGTEIITCKVTGRYYGLVHNVTDRMVAAGGRKKKPAIKGKRVAFFEQKGVLKGKKATIYEGNSLTTGSELGGPAIIERYGDAVVIPPEFTGTVDRWGTISLEKD